MPNAMPALPNIQRPTARVLTEDRILDLVLRPAGRLTVKRIAAELGLTPTRVSMILRSASFQAKLAAARALRHSYLNERLMDLAETTAESLLEAVKTKEATVSETLEIARFAAETLGYSPRAAEPKTVVNVDASLLLEAREALRKTPLIEGEAEK